MSFDGYLSFGGVEILNVDRFEAYAEHGGVRGWRSRYRNGNLAALLGDDPYTMPQFDDTPWFDDQDPDSTSFYGLYPTNITGIDDSTRSSVILESIGDGGFPGRLRHGTRQIVVEAILLASDDGGADYGLSWLKSALLAGQGGDCVGTGYNGATMCFLSKAPFGVDAGNANDCLDDLQRYYYRCSVTNGPTVTARKSLREGGAMWNVQFTITVGNPWRFGNLEPILDDWLNPGKATPNVGGGVINSRGYVWVNQTCAEKTYTPVFDPSCPDLIMPPTAPSVPLGCYTLPSSWRRRVFTIPEQFSRVWSDAVPYLQIRTQPGKPVRNLRVRLYADANQDFDPDDGPCSYCADLLITYIPDNGIFTIDGRSEEITFTSAGQTRRADSLVLNSNGSAIDWPQLSCGVQYVGTVDMLQTQSTPFIDLSLAPKSR